MKKNMKSTVAFLVIIYLLTVLIIFLYPPPQIEGNRRNGGPMRIGGDNRFSGTGSNISYTVYNQNSYCSNNPQSPICNPK